MIGHRECIEFSWGLSKCEEENDEITALFRALGTDPLSTTWPWRIPSGDGSLNNEKGVLIDAEGEDGALEGFIKGLTELAPPLARIETLEAISFEPRGTPFSKSGRARGPQRALP